jgi:hypothetical protein
MIEKHDIEHKKQGIRGNFKIGTKKKGRSSSARGLRQVLNRPILRRYSVEGKFFRTTLIKVDEE